MAIPEIFKVVRQPLAGWRDMSQKEFEEALRQTDPAFLNMAYEFLNKTETCWGYLLHAIESKQFYRLSRVSQ